MWVTSGTRCTRPSTTDRVLVHLMSIGQSVETDARHQLVGETSQADPRTRGDTTRRPPGSVRTPSTRRWPTRPASSDRATDTQVPRAG
jgi:hypothetical protein